MWSRRSAIERCPSPWNRIRKCPTVTDNGLVKGTDILLKQILCSKNRKYHCPSPALYLLLLGINIFGFTAKGIAWSQIDDSTCFHNTDIYEPVCCCLLFFWLIIYEFLYSRSWGMSNKILVRKAIKALSSFTFPEKWYRIQWGNYLFLSKFWSKIF